MSLEDRISELTTAIKDLAATVRVAQVAVPFGTSAGAAPASAPAAANTTKPKSDPKPKPGPTHDRSAVNAAVNEVKDQLGIEAAKSVLAQHGYKKLADVEDAKFDAVYASAKEALTATGDAGGSDDGL